MSQRLQTAGRFKANILAHGVTATKDNGYPQWVAKFAAFAQEGPQLDANNRQVKDESGRPVMIWRELDDTYEITGFMLLAYNDKKTGQQTFSNNFTSLQESLGWTPDPNDIFGSLQNLDLSNRVVQIVVDEQEYDGKMQLRVVFVNPEDYEGTGVQRLDSDGLTKLQGDWGALFRAKFGNAGGAAPAPKISGPKAPASAPAASPKTPAPVAGKAPSATPPKAPVSEPPKAPVAEPHAPPKEGEAYAGGECGQDEAWAKFASQQGNLSEGKLSDEWFRLLKEHFNAETDDQIKKLTKAQWAWFRDNAEPLPF